MWQLDKPIMPLTSIPPLSHQFFFVSLSLPPPFLFTSALHRCLQSDALSLHFSSPRAHLFHRLSTLLDSSKKRDKDWPEEREIQSTSSRQSLITVVAHRHRRQLHHTSMSRSQTLCLPATPGRNSRAVTTIDGTAALGSRSSVISFH